MSDLSDRIATLNQSVSENTEAVNAAVAKITAIPGTGGTSTDPDVPAAITALDAANAQLATNTSALNSAQPAPAA